MPEKLSGRWVANRPLSYEPKGQPAQQLDPGADHPVPTQELADLGWISPAPKATANKSEGAS